MIRTKKSFELRTSVFYAEPEEAKMREPRRGELWVFLAVMGAILVFNLFAFYGMWKAVEVFLQKVGLGG